MSDIRLDPFPPFDPEAPAMVHDAELMIGGAPVPVTLWFAAAGPRDEAHLDPVRPFLADPEACIARALVAISADPLREDTKEYIDHHRKELPDTLGGLSDEAFLAEMRCLHVHLQPDEREVAHLNFTITPALTQYVITIAVTAHGALRYVGMQS